MEAWKSSVAILILSATAASSAVLNFDNVTSSNIDDFVESGFEVATSGFLAGTFGNPLPSLATQAGGATASFMQVGGGQFTFNGFDLADGGGGGTLGVTIQGFLGATQIFSTVLTPTDSFMSVASPSLASIDKLVFSNDAQGGWLNIDNVDLGPSKVPLPASALLLGLGLGAIGLQKRGRKT